MRLLLGVGLLLVSAGLLTMTAVDASSGWTTLIPGFLLAGAGVGLINPPLASTAVGVVHHSRSGMASGINNTFRQVGIATGIAGLGAVFQHEITRKTEAALVASSPGHQVLSAAHGRLSGALVSGEVAQLARHLSPGAQAALSHSYRVGFTSAFTSILIIAAAIALTGAIFAFALVRSRDFVSTGDLSPAARRSSGPAIRRRVGFELIPVAGQDRQPWIARIGRVRARARAQRERRPARVGHLHLVLAGVAQPRIWSGTRRSRRRGTRGH